MRRTLDVNRWKTQKSLFSVDGFRVTIAGKTGKQYGCRLAEELVLNNGYAMTLKAVLKFVNRRKMNKEALITSYDHLEESQLLALYDVFLDKLEHSCFSKRFSTQRDVLKNGRESYIALSLEDKCQILSEILHLFQCNATLSNLSLLGSSKQSGRLYMSKNLSDKDSWYIIHQSVTGFYEQHIPLAPYKKS